NENGIRQAKKEIVEFVRNGLQQKHQDSPVHQVLRDLRITRELQSPQLTKCQIIRYRLKAVSHKWIALITGEIQGVKVADIWVNSENSNMQMARYFDHSISGVIRYLGAKKDIVGYVFEDTIADELATIMGTHNMVPPATIIVTDS